VTSRNTILCSYFLLVMVSTLADIHSGEPEQELISPQDLPALVKDWVKGDVDARIRWNGGPFAPGTETAALAPTIFSTRHIAGMPCFGDDLIRRVAESTGVELSPEENAKLLRGVFFVDVSYKSIAYVAGRQMDLGQDAVRATTDTAKQVATSVTASDFLDAFLEVEYTLWAAQLAPGPVKGLKVQFGKDITRDQVLRLLA